MSTPPSTIGRLLLGLSSGLLVTAAACRHAPPADPMQRATGLARRVIILDSHIDVPYRLEDGRDDQGRVTEDVTGPTAAGHFDYPRAVEGGLDVAFMSIYVPARCEEEGCGKTLADKLIDTIEAIVKRAPGKFALARSVDDVERNFAANRVSLPLGMENGTPIEGDLGNLDYFYGRGIRYITLAHSKDNHICDSSYDDRHTWKGLSPFGRRVVDKMNALGILVDVSHVSDDAFFQIIERSKVPVIASHSSCRHFTPGWERNMSDEMLKALAKKGGVVQITFGSAFVDAAAQKQSHARWKAVSEYRDKNQLERDDPKVRAFKEAYLKANPRIYATVETVADHIDHVVRLVGVDHVGLGSDFDGLGDSLPTGLKDVSDYPNLIRVLLERGYTEQDIEKVCSKNLLRVWRAVEEHALRHEP